MKGENTGSLGEKREIKEGRGWEGWGRGKVGLMEKNEGEGEREREQVWG